MKYDYGSTTSNRDCAERYEDKNHSPDVQPYGHCSDDFDYVGSKRYGGWLLFIAPDEQCSLVRGFLPDHAWNIYAKDWHLVNIPPDQPVNMLKLFALQFFQPLLWFR